MKFTEERHRKTAATELEERWQWGGQKDEFLQGLWNVSRELLEKYNVARSNNLASNAESEVQGFPSLQFRGRPGAGLFPFTNTF